MWTRTGVPGCRTDPHSAARRPGKAGLRRAGGTDSSKASGDRHHGGVHAHVCTGLQVPCAAPRSGDTARRAIGRSGGRAAGGESSPLYVRLYEQGLIDSGFSAGYEWLKGACLVSASGDSKDPAAVRDAILDEAARLSRDGLDEALFTRLKKSMFGRRLTDLDSFSTICCRMCECWFGGCGVLPVPGSV